MTQKFRRKTKKERAINTKKNSDYWSSSEIKQKLFFSRMADVKRDVVFICQQKLNSAGILDINGIPLNRLPMMDLFDKYTSEFKEDPVVSYMESNYKKRQEVIHLIEASKKDGNEYVYFFVNKQRKICKIGYSIDPSSRMQSVQTGCPYVLEIAGVMIGGYRLEKALHERFNKYKMVGEWFEIRGDIKKFLIEQFYIT